MTCLCLTPTPCSQGSRPHHLSLPPPPPSHMHPPVLLVLPDSHSVSQSSPPPPWSRTRLRWPGPQQPPPPTGSLLLPAPILSSAAGGHSSCHSSAQNAAISCQSQPRSSPWPPDPHNRPQLLLPPSRCTVALQPPHFTTRLPPGLCPNAILPETLSEHPT